MFSKSRNHDSLIPTPVRSLSNQLTLNDSPPNVLFHTATGLFELLINSSMNDSKRFRWDRAIDLPLG